MAIGESIPDQEERETKEHYTVVGSTTEPIAEPVAGVEATVLVRHYMLGC